MKSLYNFRRPVLVVVYEDCSLYFGIREQKNSIILENRFINIFQNILHYDLYTLANIWITLIEVYPKHVF